VTNAGRGTAVQWMMPRVKGEEAEEFGGEKAVAF